MKHISRIPLIMLALTLAFAAAPQAVFAHDGERDETDDNSSQDAEDTIKSLLERRREASQKRHEDFQKESESEGSEHSRLNERFKKSCENKRESFKNRLENIAERSQRHVERLDKIVERVKTFKENNSLSVENYDALLAEIEAKKSVVHDVQEAAKQAAEAEFSCERDQAREAVAAFRDVLHQQIDALKDYKTAVKNLIVAVKTAFEATKPEEESSDEDQ